MALGWVLVTLPPIVCYRLIFFFYSDLQKEISVFGS